MQKKPLYKKADKKKNKISLFFSGLKRLAARKFQSRFLCEAANFCMMANSSKFKVQS